MLNTTQRSSKKKRGRFANALLLVLSKHVSLERTGLIEPCATVGALVRALSGVAPPMPVEVAAVLELARAEGAVVRPLARVHPNVAAQVGTVCAGVIAVGTLDPGLFFEEELRAAHHGTGRDEVTQICAKRGAAVRRALHTSRATH